MEREMGIGGVVPQHLVYISSPSHNGFVNRLVKDMGKAGINVFIETGMRKGGNLGNPWKRIEESRIALVIFWSRYRRLTWCLDELVMIKKGMDEGKLLVIPVFYKVKPATVRRLEGDLGLQLWNRGKNFDDTTLTKWNEALQSISSKTGFMFKEMSPEADFIEEIVDHVKRLLTSFASEERENECILPSPERVEEAQLKQWLKQLEAKLEFQPDKTRLIGVVGVHGESKTNLVKELFKRSEKEFQCCLLLENIGKIWKDHGLHYLRMILLEKLLMNVKLKASTDHESDQNDQLLLKVLVVFDGVSDRTQIEGLLQNHKWMKEGSRIIITTCDKSLVEGLVDDIFEVQELNFSSLALSDHICAPEQNMMKTLIGRELREEDKTRLEMKHTTLEESKETQTIETDHISVFFCSDKQDTDEASFMKDILKELNKQYITPLIYSLSERKSLNLEMQCRFGVGIIILSNNYACSIECLDQLVAIMEHRKAKDLLMIPVYFKVKPSDIGEQQGNFGEAFLQLGNLYQAEQIEKWRAAIIETVSEDGYEWIDGTQLTLAKEIVRNACLRLYSRTSKNLIDFLSSLDHSHPSELQIVGIWGMAGIGKTTIAREIFKIVAPQYDSCYFLQDFHLMCQMKGLNRLRDDFFSTIFGEENIGIAACNIKPSFMREVFRRKTMLIVVDDVTNARDAEALVGGFGWFSPGHRIILTSRNRQVLVQCNVKEPYQMQGLSEFESFRLSKQHSEGEDSSIRDIMNYANGNPLALMVSGLPAQKLQSNNMKEHLQKLRQNPPSEIQKAFRRSFDGLNENEKNIFLDLACFFRGENKDHVVQLLDASGFFTEFGICGLVDESLITLLDTSIKMHTLCQDMGRFIVREEDNDPGKRSRLWDAHDIVDVLAMNSGTEVTEGMFLDTSNLMCEVHPTVFNSLCSLRLLKFYSSTPGHKCGLSLPRGLESLPDELRLLHWENYPLKSLPPEFNFEYLVELNMPYSNIEKLWEGAENVSKLKKLRLSHSHRLSEIPRFTRSCELEHIDLEGCTSLVEVSSSISYLSKLVFLNLKDCYRVRSAPAMVHLESLEVLNLSGCSELEDLQDFSINLKKLYLAGTAIRELPSSIENLTKLLILDLENCKWLQHLPIGMSNLTSLTTLKLSGCSNLETLPKLDALYLRGSQHLNFTKTTLEASATLIPHHSVVEESSPLISRHSAVQESVLDCSETLLNSLNTCRSNKEKEHVIEFGYTSTFQGVRNQCWQSIESMAYIRCKLERPILLSLESRLYALVSLLLCNASLLDIPEDIYWLSSLKALNLGGNGFNKLPESIKDFPKLQSLKLRHCRNLRSIPDLPRSLELLNAHGCVSLKSIPQSFEHFSRHYIFSNCFNLIPEGVRQILAQSLSSVESIAIAQQQEPLKGPAFSICVPASTGRMSSSYLGSGSSVVIQLTPSMRKSLLGFVISVVIAFQNNYPNGVGFGIRCICRWKTKKGLSHRVERFFHCWASRDAPNIKKDHMFVFCGVKMHPSTGEGKGFDIVDDLVVFEYYPVDEHNNLLDTICVVKKSGVSVITNNTNNMKRPASPLDPWELSNEVDMQRPRKRSRLRRVIGFVIMENRKRKREQSLDRFRNLAKASPLVSGTRPYTSASGFSSDMPFVSTMSRDGQASSCAFGKEQSQDDYLGLDSLLLSNPLELLSEDLHTKNEPQDWTDQLFPQDIDNDSWSEALDTLTSSDIPRQETKINYPLEKKSVSLDNTDPFDLKTNIEIEEGSALEIEVRKQLEKQFEIQREMMLKMEEQQQFLQKLLRKHQEIRKTENKGSTSSTTSKFLK